MSTRPHDLNLRHLRALVAIRQHGRLGNAADAVNLSQPALTQGLAKLESQFRYPLFERRASGMLATSVGNMVVDRVEAALQHLSKETRKMNRTFAEPDRLLTMTQLRAFLALVDAGSFTEAATAVGLSQTAVHRAVGDLERIMGLAVVERRGRGIWVNRNGRSLARGARLAMAELAAALADLGSDDDGEQLSFGALPTSRPFLVPAALARMHKDHPNARFEVLEGNWREMQDPLRDGIIDMVVGGLRPYEINDLTQTPIQTDRLVIAAGAGHPLAGPSAASIEDLAHYPWILSPSNSPLRTEWEKLFAGAERPKTPVETGSVMIIGRLLTEGNFLTLLSPLQVALQVKAGLLATVGPPLEQSTRTIGVITRAGWRPTQLQKHFIETLHEASRDTAGQYGQSIVALGWV